MATKITHLCDISGVEIPEDTAKIVLRVQNGEASFAVSLELSDAEKAKLLKALKPYAEKGRDIGPVISPAPKSSAANPLTAEIRAWAIAQPELKVSEKGRIPADVQEAFFAAHPDKRPTE